MRIVKILLIAFLILVIAIFYLSIFGIKTDKFNNKITNKFLKINKKINLNLSDVNYLLNPYNFTINIKTKNSQILLDGKSLGIKKIQTNIALRSLINEQFSVNDLQITIKDIKLNNVIALARVFQNSPQLFVLGNVIKDGLITANINLNFDEKGRIKENYKIEGSIKQANLIILNQLKLKNLNLKFNTEKNIYLFKQIDMNLNNTKINSQLIEIKKKRNSFFVKGKFSNEKKNFDVQELKPIFEDLLNDVAIQKIEFSSKNNFSFIINKKLEFNSFKLKSTVDLNQLTFKSKHLKLKPYFPSFNEEIKLTEHEIVINYTKDKFDIRGDGNILLENKLDSLSYKIIKNKNGISFDSKINLNNNSLFVDFLDYEKKEKHDSLFLLKGNFKKNDRLRFDLISLKEKNSRILIKGLDLNKNFKIMNIESFNINYINNEKILNNLNLKKDNLNFIIDGESFDASRIINDIMDNDEESSSFFLNLNSKINIKIKRTYIDEVNYIDNLYGNINFNDNKLTSLKLNSIFPNKKKISLSIETIDKLVTITKLATSYPKPLIKRYDFVKGFEEGSLNFYSSKKGGISNSVLTIDNFKVKKVPIFAKLLSLASLQGVADLLTGEGIRFTDFEMKFSNQKGNTTIEEMYAIGPAVSRLMDGYIEAKKIVSLRGTLVPATTINRTIASIPLLGKILVGGKTGEGVFGVSFKIKGAPKNLKTTVNPVKTLTPRFITRTLEKIKKN